MDLQTLFRDGLHRRDVVAILILAVLPWLFFRPLPSAGWWTGDDTAILYSIIRYGALKAFYDPYVWHHLSITNYTPMVNLSYKLDYMLFGMNPKWFYVHQLLIASVVLVLLYVLLRIYTGFFASFGASLLFLTSLPFSVPVLFIWCRHYLEGMIFIILSFIVLEMSCRKGSFTLCFLSAVAYLIAALYKEIFVPLVAVHLVAILSYKSLRKKGIFAFPFILAALLYSALRVYMLGSGMLSGAAITLESLKSLEHGIYNLAFKPTFPMILLVMLAPLARARFPVFSNRPLLTLLVALLLSCLVMLPVAGYLRSPLMASLRVSLAVALCVFILEAAAVEYVIKGVGNKLLTVPAFVALLASALMNTHQMRSAFPVALRLYKHNKKVVDLISSPSGPSCVVVLPLERGYFYRFAYFLLNHKTPKILGVCYYPCVCLKALKEAGIHKGLCVVTPTGVEPYTPSCRGYRNAPLSVSVSYGDHIIRWSFGPYEGMYKVYLSDDGVLPTSYYIVSKLGRTHITESYEDKLVFWVAYTSPEGWTTVSPKLTLRTDKEGDQVVWHR